MQSDCSDQSLKNFIKELGFEYFSIELIKQAFTHSSYSKEHNLPYSECYERLEFLGDAVLKMVTTDFLYKKYDDKKEGELTKIRAVIVSDEILHKIAKKLGIEKYIKVGAAELKAQIYKLESVQACVMEALFGALYLSSDKNILKDFIIKNLSELAEELAQNKTVYNAKALLQEYTQSKSQELPVYEITSETGEAHDKTFTISVSYKNKVLAQASGKTKKHAQQEAAFLACKQLKLIKD
ncbi:MAG: ribonuclease III [Clostridium sp.]|nr:ribonuclease III [Clostridium sp.]